MVDSSTISSMWRGLAVAGPNAGAFIRVGSSIMPAMYGDSEAAEHSIVRNNQITGTEPTGTRPGLYRAVLP